MKAYEEAEKIAAACGFHHTAYLDVRTLELREEVRDMCKVNTCGMYGKNWACPPACGSLDKCREQVKAYKWGILLQTVGTLEDSLDFEGMKEIEEKHKVALLACVEKLRETYPEMLPLGSGCCTVCATCAGSDAPCRFPEKRMSSMEAFGLVVSDVCTKNGMKYYYGPNTLAYTSCCLLL